MIAERLLEQYRGLLQVAAAQLSGSIDVPVSTREICRVVGVGVKRSAEHVKPVLINARRNAEILLPRRTIKRESYPDWRDSELLDGKIRWLEARERWWIAHEIGHLILLQSRVPAPLGPSEYWPIEHLCDDFAAHLLLPDKVMAVATAREADPDKTLHEWLGLSDHLAQNMQVPWELACCRLHSWNQSIWFYRIRQESKSAFRVAFSALPKRLDQRAVIRDDDPLGAALTKSIANRIVDITAVQLAPLKSQSCATAASLRRRSESVYIVVQGDLAKLSTRVQRRRALAWA